MPPYIDIPQLPQPFSLWSNTDLEARTQFWEHRLQMWKQHCRILIVCTPSKSRSEQAAMQGVKPPSNALQGVKTTQQCTACNDCCKLEAVMHTWMCATHHSIRRCEVCEWPNHKLKAYYKYVQERWHPKKKIWSVTEGPRYQPSMNTLLLSPMFGIPEGPHEHVLLHGASFISMGHMRAKTKLASRVKTWQHPNKIWHEEPRRHCAIAQHWIILSQREAHHPEETSSRAPRLQDRINSNICMCVGFRCPVKWK